MKLTSNDLLRLRRVVADLIFISANMTMPQAVREAVAKNAQALDAQLEEAVITESAGVEAPHVGSVLLKRKERNIEDEGIALQTHEIPEAVEATITKMFGGEDGRRFSVEYFADGRVHSPTLSWDCLLAFIQKTVR